MISFISLEIRKTKKKKKEKHNQRRVGNIKFVIQVVNRVERHIRIEAFFNDQT